MTSKTSWFALSALAYGALVHSTPLRAQGTGEPAKPEGPAAPTRAQAPAAPPQAPLALEPPRVDLAVEPVLPVEARATTGEVVVRVLVEASGTPSEAELMQSAGEPLDSAARDAALRTTFQPARKDGQPLAARILMRFVFPLAPPAEVPTVPPSAASTGAPAPKERAHGAIEVEVAGRQSATQRLRASADTVTVVELEPAKKRSADLGEVLARTPGVVVRRSGGLGSYVRFSLNGLTDDQIRFFLDGVPLEIAGYAFGIENVPVDLMNRVEIYRGVVPVRFGTDALGGAVNLVTETMDGIGATAGYELGPFGIHRLAGSARYRHDPSGFVLSGNGYFDVADNDYDVDVDVADERGRLRREEVPRFHDFYRAYGGSIEAGFVDRPWAKRLVVRGFTGKHDKELQHNLVMTVPYGEVRYDVSVTGLTLRYEQPLVKELELEIVGNYGYTVIDFQDKAEWVYDWFGERIRERRMAGEIDGIATDQTNWQHGWYARALLTYRPHKEHVLRASVAPEYATRTGDERIQLDPSSRDPLTAKRSLRTLVSGIEYEWNAWPRDGAPVELEDRSVDEDYRIQNLLMAKHYHYTSNTEEVVPGGAFRDRSVESSTFGVGDGIRVTIDDGVYIKGSYEFTTRLPNPDETFGDGRLIAANLELEPETSHNFNLGPRVELKRSPIGDVIVDVGGFLREAKNLIQPIGNDRTIRNQNVLEVRSVGAQAELEWTSPGRWLQLQGSATYEDTRNNSSEGTFADFAGDRLPGRPYLFASWQAKLRFAKLLSRHDELEPFYLGRFVEEYFRGWESQGLRAFKQTVDAQTTHGVGVTYSFTNDELKLAATLEVQNLTDAKTFDFYGVQKPGRGFYAKLTGEFQ